MVFWNYDAQGKYLVIRENKNLVKGRFEKYRNQGKLLFCQSNFGKIDI